MIGQPLSPHDIKVDNLFHLRHLQVVAARRVDLAPPSRKVTLVHFPFPAHSALGSTLILLSHAS
jgi:hypothetical protein